MLKASEKIIKHKTELLKVIYLSPMSLRESLLGQTIVLSPEHQLGNLGMTRLEGLNQIGPMTF